MPPAVKLLGNLPDPFLAEIAGQPEALRRAARGLAARQSCSATSAPARRARRCWRSAAWGARTTPATPPVTHLGGRGVAAVMADAAELLHFRAAGARPRALVVVVSQSGRSAEVVRLAEALHARPARPFVVAVTNGLENPLAGLADLALDTEAGEEHGPSTMTFAASLVTLAGRRARPGRRSDIGRVVAAVHDDAERAAAAIEAAAGGRARTPPRAARRAGSRTGRSLPLLGRGTARAASEMGALTLKEAARFPAESLEAAQFRHGPLELAGAGTAVAVVATEPPRATSTSAWPTSWPGTARP